MINRETQVFFSIIIPFYNESLYIKDTLISVLNQQYTNFEIICVNDGSVDDSEKVITNTIGSDTRVKIYKQHHLGKCIARNTGVGYAKGKWICFLNAGDNFFQNHLRVLHEMIEADTNAEVVCTSELNGNEARNFEQMKFFRQTIEMSIADLTPSVGFSLNQFAIKENVVRNNLFPSMNLIVAEELLFLRQVFFSHKVTQKKIISSASKLKLRFEKDTLTIVEKVYWTKLASDIFINNYSPAKDIVNRIRRNTRSYCVRLLLSYAEYTQALKVMINFSIAFLIFMNGFLI